MPSFHIYQASYLVAPAGLAEPQDLSQLITDRGPIALQSRWLFEKSVKNFSVIFPS